MMQHVKTKAYVTVDGCTNEIGNTLHACTNINDENVPCQQWYSHVGTNSFLLFK